MNNLEDMAVTNPAPAKRGLIARALGWVGWHPIFVIVTAVIALPFLFYAEEDWRGKRAWERCKAEFRAKGRSLEWADALPRPVPGDQNFYAAPYMMSWFTGREANDFTRRLGMNNFNAFMEQHGSNYLADVVMVPVNANIPSEDADVVVQFLSPVVSLAKAGENPVSAGLPSNNIPLIIMNQVPLSEAIKNLARQEGLNYMMDPKIPYGKLGPNGLPVPEPSISQRWTNITAYQALQGLLKDNNLQFLPDAKTGVGRVTLSDLQIVVEPAAQEKLAKVLDGLLEAVTNGISGPTALASQRFTIYAGSFNRMKPVRIFVRSDTMLTTAQVTDMFRAAGLPKGPYGSPQQPQVAYASSNSYRVTLNGNMNVSARDYLAWTDGMAGDFDLIREALKRPYARIDGDFDDQSETMIPSFMCFRMLAQLMTQRVQSELLLGKPEDALRDLTLLHGVRRLLEARPEGKPMTLVAAMINVAIANIYAQAVEDGLRLQVWREPELRVIQQQLGEIDLPPYITKSIEYEQVAGSRRLQTMTPEEYLKRDSLGAPPDLSKRWKDPTCLFLTFAPSGWVYQNIVSVLNAEDAAIKAYDSTNGIILPGEVEKAYALSDEIASHHSPANALAAAFVPRYDRVFTTLTRTQTMVNEERIVCALERYQSAHGEYPETLAALATLFPDRMPHDIFGGKPLKYRRDGQKFLLYSIGWNEVDDGGVPNPKTGVASNTVDDKKGDFVWAYRENLFQ